MADEERERAATQILAWMADRAEETGGGWMSITYAWTGTFRDDGVLVPFDELGFSVIPPYRVSAVAAEDPEGFTVQLLFYCAPVDRYAVVEVVWPEEPETPALPVGKPAPEGSAPLRWKEEGEDAPEGSIVAWASEEAPCPALCRTYPEELLMPTQGLTEDEIRLRFPQLWEHHRSRPEPHKGPRQFLLAV